MRNSIKRSIALFMIAVFLVPIMWNQNDIVARAASTPSFSEKTFTIEGIGENHQIVINNKVAKSKYAWSSSNSAVAKVSSKGLVTSAGSGTATIQCKITYKTKKTKTLSCKVIVSVPATAINISDLTLVNNAYQLKVGGTVDLNAVITPSNSTDQAYWYIDDNELSDEGCISLDSNNQGIVTGVKPGKAVVRVKAAPSAAVESDIDDTIIIEVAKPSANVKSMQITNSNEIQIVFDSPIKKDTVITSSGTLSSNITITMGKDKNVSASDPGKLTPSLSTDNMTLTISTANSLRGSYGINVSGLVQTTGGIAITEAYQYINYTDTVAPYIAGVTLDDTGVIATITFSEPMNFTSLKVSDAKCLSSTAYSATSIAVINNVSNYAISNDYKSLTINLSTIAPADYGKVFTVVLSGIKDTAGNYPANSYVTATLQTSSSTMPQANVVSVTRTGYYTLTTTFDRAIKTPGVLQVGSGSIYPGVVDTNNKRQVNYTISASDALLSGNVTVYVSSYSSYNVAAGDVSSYTPRSFSVFFTTDTVAPVLVSNEYNPDTAILKLTYSEPVALSASTGVVAATLTTLTEDVKSVNVNYTQIADTDDNVILIQLSNMSASGAYLITLPSGFTTDNFKNLSAASTFQLTTASSTSTELPAPYAIAQSSTNVNQIYVYFSNKLDKASAETVSNYIISGVTITSATLSENTSTGATVLLTTADGSIDVTVDRPVTISGVKGYNNSYTAIVSYQTTVKLTENVKPYLVSTVYERTGNWMKLTFNEAIKGSMTVSVTQKFGGSSTVITGSVVISGNVAYVTLGTVPANGSYLILTVTSNTITDVSGNACVSLNGVNAAVTY